jgi:hypothetical protein
MSHAQTLNSAQMQRMAEIAAQLGPWSMPVVEALRTGLIAVQWLTRNQRAPLDVMRRIDRPLLVWIGDDDDESCGPDGWRCAHQVTRWAKGGIVHAAGGEARHYAIAVQGTLVERRFLLVETSSRYALAWAKLMQGKPVLGILPRSGPHPVASTETRH